jgi:hypothetical protein
MTIRHSISVLHANAGNSIIISTCIRQHTSAYVSIHQHTSAGLQHANAGNSIIISTCIRQHTSAYVSIRQHTSAYMDSVCCYISRRLILVHAAIYLAPSCCCMQLYIVILLYAAIYLVPSYYCTLRYSGMRKAAYASSVSYGGIRY